jgi:tetratricopeptide (TPR) repeat protein
MGRALRGALAGVSGGAVAAIVATGMASPATAGADKLLTAPPGAWVVPVAVPSDDGKGAAAAVKLLLRDEQDDLQPGKVTRYFESVFKVQTPQGLPTGAIAFSWNPDIQTATLHKLVIHRGTQVIDVLGSGQSFTVMRRETNLENAVLDGQLTASIQPEGLQVGDIVDFSVSIATSDPAVGDHVEEAGAGWNGIPFARAHFRAQWPSSVPMRVQVDGGIATPRVMRKDGVSSIEVTMDGVQPLVMPKGAPMRFQYGRLIEMTDLPAWSGIATLMMPLYAKAETLAATSPLRTEIAKIKAASADPKAQAEAALALVQDRVRYVFLGMNDGGLVPADADTTWSRRFGDCKGKTVLLLALLHGLGIDAHPVIVSSKLGDGLDSRLPEIGLFDHVLVQATIGGRGYWLDGTRVGDRSLDGIETPYFRWGLPLVPGNAALVAMVPPPYTGPQTDVAIRIDASAGLTPPAPIHIDRVVRGDEAVAINLALANLVGDARDQALREFWRQRYDFAEPKTVTTSFDPEKRELHLAMDGTTKMDWSQGWYEADHVWVGYTADFSRDPGPNHDAPYAVGYPDYTHVTETILLPPHSGTFTITPGSDVNQTAAGMEYRRHAKIEGNIFVVEESNRATAPEFPAAQAPAAQETLRALAKKGVFINQPDNYAGPAADVSAALAVTPTTAAGWLDQGNLLLGLNRNQEAIDRLNKAIALDPKNAFALADRGMAHLALKDQAAAKADLDAAATIDPRNVVVFHGRGLIAQEAGTFQEAVDQFTGALSVKPDSYFAMWHRARAYHALGKDDQALADAAAYIAHDPTDTEMHLLRANILKIRGDEAGAAHEADTIVAANPRNSYALVVAGKIYAAVGRQDDAMRSLASAIAIKPDGYIYLNRYNIRPKSDVAGRKADIDEALRLDPSDTETIATAARFQGEQGDWAGSVASLTTALARQSTDTYLLSQRAVAYAEAGDQVRALKDFDASRAGFKTAGEHNNLCYDVARRGVLLSQALDECERAIAIEPDSAAIRDSRAFVLLRLGRIDDALADYDRVLAKVPSEPNSLYGRSLAEARKGDQAAAARDAAAALKIDPKVRERFDGYGMTDGAPSKVVTATSKP